MMKTKLTLFVTVLAAALFGVGCASTEPAFVSDGLVAYYPFNGDAKDESGNGNDGEVKGATLSGDRSGDQDAAYEFDGKDDFINLGDKPAFDFGTGDFTFSLWFKASGAQTGKYFIGKYDYPNAPSYGVGTGLVTNGYAFIRATAIREARGNVNLGDNKWHHMVAAYDRDSNLVIYVDGSVEATTGISGSQGAISNAINLFIGKIHSGNHFGGKIDDVRIYNRALSAEEVKALYDLEKPKSK